MASYTFAELADMHLFYGRAYGNASEARRLYILAFPRRRHPSVKIFARVDQRLRDNGTFKSRKFDCGRARNEDSYEREENILEMVTNDPSTSTKKISISLGTSKTTVWRVLHNNRLYPFHLQRVQALLPRDFVPRMEFCRWLLERHDVDHLFLFRILFTDEACFTREGIFNFHNKHNWSEINPHQICESKHQYQFSINVWAGIIGNSIVGPYVLPDRLTGADYREFLADILPELLEDVPLQTLMNMWFMHDGAPPHFSVIAREYLNREFVGRWIGRSGPVNWPARSPDLNPLDFFFWGHLKDIVYSTPVTDIDNLKYRVFEACESIRNKPGILERVRQSMIRRLNICVETGGQHFQNLL